MRYWNNSSSPDGAQDGLQTHKRLKTCLRVRCAGRTDAVLETVSALQVSREFADAKRLQIALPL